jgi:hypothetical protein
MMSNGNGEQSEPRRTTAYWMGEVDTKLKELIKKFDDFIDSDTKRWIELRAWQQTVEHRLTNGTRVFEDHDKRLMRIEGTDPDKTGIVTFPWIRDKILIPALVYSLTLIIAYGFGKLTGVIP